MGIVEAVQIVVAIAGGIFSLWPTLMYFLPPDKAKELKPVGEFLKKIANTPSGFKRK